MTLTLDLLVFRSSVQVGICSNCNENPIRHSCKHEKCKNKHDDITKSYCCTLCIPREVSEKDAKDYADSIHAIFVEASAKNAININEVFIEISECTCLVSLTRIPAADTY